MTDRRTFLKSAGLLTAAAAVINPAQIFARNNRSESGKPQGKKELELEWCPFMAKMKHVFTIANS